jgi:hypothetical protein
MPSGDTGTQITIWSIVSLLAGTIISAVVSYLLQRSSFAEARFGCYIVRQNKRPVRYAPNRVLDCTRYC